MRRSSATAVIALALSTAIAGHTFGPAVTWNREISRLVYDRCASCHRPGGPAFSMMTYGDVQPRANEIKEAVLTRRMPPWGAVKGFGNFRNDGALSQEQIELVTRWVDGGIRRGNNARVMPKQPTFTPAALFELPSTALRVSGPRRLDAPQALDGVLPERVPPGLSFRIIARLPGGSVEPLVWLHEYDDRYKHPFLFRRTLALPAGTVIEGVPDAATIALIPAENRP
jgi:mono/diheme cytochrome c family protein